MALILEQSLLDLLEDLRSDESTPKAVKLRINSAMHMLEASGDSTIILNRVQAELEEASDHESIDAYTRTQLFSVMSRLEQSLVK